MLKKEFNRLLECEKANNRKVSYYVTHASYVILTDKFAYKIKKTIKYSFLDFSTLNRRKFFCEKEILLNRRLTSGIYLDLIPVIKTGDSVLLNESKIDGDVIDYAIKMKKLDNDKLMTNLLKKNLVNEQDILKIASIISHFHKTTDVIDSQFDSQSYKSRFDNLLISDNLWLNKFGAHILSKVKNAIKDSTWFIDTFYDQFLSRFKRKMIKDCHGDLHSKNIFLYEEPVIFDCIEFNDLYRHIDVLSEIAFFLMDLEHYQKQDLSDIFLKYYLKNFPEVIQTSDDEKILNYFKAYRANVRAKVNALRLSDGVKGEEQEIKTETLGYLTLMRSYLDKAIKQ